MSFIEYKEAISQLNDNFLKLSRSINSDDREFVNSTVSIYNNDTNYYNEVILLFQICGFTEHDSFILAKHIDYKGFIEFSVISKINLE